MNCEACDFKVAESQAHLMSCPGYSEFRAGRDMERDSDLVAFFRDVLLAREKRKCMKK